MKMYNPKNQDRKGINSEKFSIFMYVMIDKMFGGNNFILIRVLLSVMIVSCLGNISFAQQPEGVAEAMIQKFYTLNQKPLFWFSSDQNIDRATEWLTMIESADHLGIISDKLQSDQIRVALLSNKNLENIYKEQRDRQITGWVLNFMKEIHEGNIRFDFDGVSISRDSIYINELLKLKPSESVSQIVSRLDCQDHDYLVLKQFMNDSIRPKDTVKFKKLVVAMNYRRYLAVNHSSEYIVANIPSAEATYFRNDSLKIKMRAVVGMKSNPSPTIASYFTSIVTFPLWNVPHSISVKEILPKVQKNMDYLEKNDYQVVDTKGRVIDYYKLKWGNYTKNNFPYLFRQATGPRNALGVLKFNLQSPFSIYLHSTNSQSAFARERRFLSHGCIRLEKALELAKALAPDKIDIDELKQGKKNTKSETIKLAQKTAVFITYMPVTVNGEKVSFFSDVYGLIK